MTVIAERTFTVTVKLEVPTIAALDEVTARIEKQLPAALPVALAGVKTVLEFVGLARSRGGRSPR